VSIIILIILIAAAIAAVAAIDQTRKAHRATWAFDRDAYWLTADHAIIVGAILLIAAGILIAIRYGVLA
jgi:hypothetical protein